MNDLENINISLSHMMDQLKDTKDFDKKQFLSDYYPKQVEYILNNKKSRVTFYYGGARAGKTAGNKGKLVYYDLFHFPQIPGYIIICGPTEKKAKELYWNSLRRLKTYYNLPWSFKVGEGLIETRNNSILFRGLKDISNAQKDQGRKIKLCIVDEPQTIRADVLEHYMNSVIIPRTIEVEGEICLTGNPPHFFHPFIQKEYDNPGNRQILTNLFDNESISYEKAHGFINSERKRRGFKKGEEDAAFRREFYGEMVFDNESTIFKATEKNLFAELPKGRSEYEKVMGIDLGYKDSDAIVVCYYDREDHSIYVVEEYEKAEQTYEQLMQIVFETSSSHGGIEIKVMDTGGLGLKGVESLMDKYSVDFIPADKGSKMNYVEMLKSEIVANRIFFKKDSKLLKEFPQIVYNWNREKIDDKSYHSDLLDALLYSFRYIHSHLKPEDTKKSTRIDEIYNEYLRSLDEDSHILDEEILDQPAYI